MSQVAFRAAGAGAENNSSTTLNVPYPASVASNELLLLVLGAGEHSIGFQTPSGFTRHPGVPSDVNIGTAATIGAECISVWYKWATGSESGNLTCSRSTGTDHFVGRMFAYNGFSATGSDPFVGSATNSGTDASMESPATSANATSNNDMGLLVCVRADDDFATMGNWDEAAESIEWTETVSEFLSTAGNDSTISVNHCDTVTSGNAIPANLETAGSSDPWWVLTCIVKESAGANTISPAGTITPAGALTKVATLARSFGGTITPAGALDADLAGDTQIAVPVSDVDDNVTGALTLTITPFSGSTTYAEAAASEPSSAFDYTNRHIEVEYAFGTGTAEVVMQLEPLDTPAAGDCTLVAWTNSPVDGDIQLLNGDDSSVVFTYGLLPVSDDYGTAWTIQSEDFTPGDMEPVHDWADLQIRFYQADDGASFVGSGGLTYVYLEAPAAGGFTEDFDGTITPAGALAKVGTFARPLAGTVTPAGALAKVATLFRSFGGTITPAGTVATPKTAPRSFAGTITPAGALSKVGTFLRNLAGTITPAGFLDRTFTPGGGGGTNYNISPHGTITPAATLAKVGTFFRSFAGTITPAATLTKAATLLRSWAGTITPAGALSKPVSRFRSYAGTITPAGSLARVRNYARSLAGTITPTGAYTRVVTWFRTFTGTITPRGALERALNGVLLFFGLTDHVPTTDLSLIDHTNDTLLVTDHDETNLVLIDHTPTTD